MGGGSNDKEDGFTGIDIVPEVPEAEITSPGDIARSKTVTIVER